MFLWKYIDIDPLAIEEIQQYYLKALPANDHFFQQLDLGIDTFMGMEIQRAVLIQVVPNAVGRIHTDFRPKDFGDQLALQIPLINCDHTITEMWKSTYDPPVQYTTNGQPYRYFDPARCDKISEFRVTRPILFRTDIPHSVSNYSNTIRKAISIRFKQDPWHLI
jgi:hypothetical protein